MSAAFTTRTRVLLVDDHPAVLERVAQLLEAEFDVADMLRDGAGIEAALDRLHPELVVLDITLPGESGFDVARRLKAAHCPAGLVFLTVHEDEDFAREAFAVGALGFVTKSRLATDLVPALRAATAGHRFISACPELDAVRAREQNLHDRHSKSS